MIIIKNTLLIFILLSFAVYCNAQKHEESLIIRLENAEKEAILKGDTIALMKLMSAQIVVQNPENTIIKYDQIMDRIKKGKIDYSSFNRTIENIAFIKNIAIVMGSETIVSKSSSPQTDKVNTRRFTNVWMKEKNLAVNSKTGNYYFNKINPIQICSICSFLNKKTWNRNLKRSANNKKKPGINFLPGGENGMNLLWVFKTNGR